MSGGDDEIHEEHEEHVNHEAWVIPYADLLTLLMAMFIALFAMSTVDVSKFKAFAIGFNEALGGGKLDAGIGGTGKATSPVVGQGNGNGPFEGGTLMPSDTSVSSQQLAQILNSVSNGKIDGQQQRETLQDIANKIESAAAGLHLKPGEVKTIQQGNGLKVTLLTDQVLFDSGHAELKPEGQQLLSLIGLILKPINNTIDIDGYTDNVPLGGGAWIDNLGLSSARADAVDRYFLTLGIPQSQMQPIGKAEQNPVADNATPAGRAQNRRVEIIVENNAIKTVLKAEGFDATPTPPTTQPVQQPASAGLGGSANPNLKQAVAGG